MPRLDARRKSVKRDQEIKGIINKKMKRATDGVFVLMGFLKIIQIPAIKIITTTAKSLGNSPPPWPGKGKRIS